MKKILIPFLVLSLCLLSPHPAQATLAMYRTTSTGKSTAWTDTGATDWFPVSGTCGVRIRVYSVSTSTSTIDIEKADSSSATDGEVMTTDHITDASSVGESWRVPSGGFVRVNITAISSGTISASITGQTCDGHQVY